MPTAPPTRLVTARFALVVASGLAYFLALGALLPTFPKFVEDALGGSSVAVGVSVAAFAVGAIVLRPYMGRLGDRYGRRLLILGGSATVTASLLVLQGAHSVPVATLARFLGGLGEAAFFVGGATMCTDLAPVERRGEAISFYSVAVYGGTAFGPFVGEAVRAAFGYSAVWWTAAALTASAFVLGVFTRETRVPHPRPEGGEPIFNRNALVPGGVLFLGLFALIAVTTFGALYLQTVGIDNAGPMFLVYGVLVLAIRIGGATLPDRIGSVRGGTIACIFAAASLFVFALVPNTFGVYFAVVLLALGMALHYPSMLLLALTGVDQHESASVVGSFGAFFDLAGGIAPVVLGAVVAVADYRVAFAVGGVFCLLGVWLLRSGLDPRVRLLSVTRPELEGAGAIEPPAAT